MNERLRLIEEYVHEHDIKIRFMKAEQLYGYDGMNPEAAREMSFPQLPTNTIVIDRNLRGDMKHRTIIHEIEEMLLMRQRGYPYWRAHKIAFRREAEEPRKIHV